MFRKLIAAAAAAAMAFDGLGAVGAGAEEKVEKVISTENVTADASGAVQSRTAEQILAYMKAHPFNFNNDTFAETPVYSGGTYSLGKVSSASLNNALNALNCVRYVAGLDEVTLDDTYGKYAQAASLVNAANGDISHSPSRPSGMSDELYNLGKTGSGSSNLGYGYSSLAYEVIFGWMSDSYGSNLSCAGHRRWCLYPLMKKTGFGHAGSATAMYAFDGFSSSTGSYNVTWPAAKMPTSMFNTGFPWTYSRDKTFSSNTVVTLTRKRDSKKWVFSGSSADGVFYINNDGYGQKGCLIFRPSGIDSYGEDQFTVTVTEGSSSFSYTVDFISACLHNNVYSYSAGKATCTSDGNTAYWYCDDCGKYFSDSACTNEITKASTVIKATGHKTTATAAKAATCTTAGNTAYWYCSNCGKYFSDSACTTQITKASTVIKATGHKTTATAAKAATCTENGNKAYWYCSNCGKYFSDSACTNEITKAGTVIKATGHKTTATAAKAATCTTAGNTAYWYCSNCGKYFSDSACTNEITKASTVIKATGHKTTATAAKAATCTTAGNTAYWYCSNCGKYFSDSACTNEITKAGTVIKATGHKTTATAAKAATCTENGNKAYWYCSNCGKYFSDSACTNEITKASTVIKATGHKTTATAAKAATCTTAGNTAYWYCSNCGKYFSDSACTTEITKASTVIKATGHSFGPWKITREPTTTSQGEKERECSVCHIHEVSAIPQLPAGTAPQITADRVTASAGKTVTVDIRIKNNPGIASLSLEAAYDTSVMTLVKAESGIYAGTSFGPVGTEPLVISWSAGGGTDNIQNGLLARLTFEVKEKAGKGKYPITLSYTEGKIYNKEHKNVNFSAVSGSVEVRSYLIGDVNGNGSVNMKDLAELQRYVNGWGNVIVEEAADLASPFGKINMKDIAALQKLLNSQ